jgi:5-methylcytosine-specific restriction endonuclease McrA
MKICWDNLENIKVTKLGNFRNTKKQNFKYVDKCEYCGNPFLASRGNFSSYKFCDQTCYQAYRLLHKEHDDKKWREDNKEELDKYYKEYRRKNREVLNKNRREYYRKPALYNTFYDRLIGIEKIRRNREDSSLLESTCSYCGKWILITNTQASNRVGALNGRHHAGEGRFYCSKECKKECSVYFRRKLPKTIIDDINILRSKGFKDTEIAKKLGCERNTIRIIAGTRKEYNKGFKPSTSREVQPELRQMVFERDEWTCQRCESTTSLHCHHITGIEQNPIESADVDNCITFCKDCHKWVHSQEGCRYFDLRRCT